MESLPGLLHRNLKSSSGEYVIDAVLPLLELLAMALIGLILAHPKIQLLPKATLTLLSKLVFVLFMPCLIFTHLGPTITLSNLVNWWFIPVNVVISTAAGFILGCLVALICRPPREFFRFTIIMTALGNTGNIPYAVVSLVCHSEDSPFGITCYADGIAYISYSQWVSFILVCTLVYHMMEPPLEHYEVVEAEFSEIEEEQEGTQENEASKPLLVEAEWPGMEEKETEHCKTPFIATVFNSINGITESHIPDVESVEEGIPRSPKSIKCLAEPKMIRKIRLVAEHTPFRSILQPPLVASVLAIILGVTPKVNTVVFGSDAALSFITDSIDMIAEAMVPSVMLVLGGMLIEGPNGSRLGIRTTVGIMVARLLVLPLIGIGVVHLAEKWNLLVSGELYRFVLLLQYTTPSAILLGAVASLRGYAVKEASTVLFWQHVFAMLSLSIYIIIYFQMLFSWA